MTPQPATPAPSAFFASVTGKDARGNQTIVFPGSLVEYATLDTANKVMAILEKRIPEAGPYTLSDANLQDAGMTWSEPQYQITGNTGPNFNVGLLWNEIQYGGYDRALALSQVRVAVIGY
jgi:hypothetical protein